MKALSVRQPWAWAIMNAGKDIETRDWLTKFRGTIAVHASKGMSKDDLQAFINATIDFYEKAKSKEMLRVLDSGKMSFGAIIGTVEITDCVEDSDSEWFFGDYGFVLANPIILPKPIPCKGALGFWNVPEEIEKIVNDQIGAQSLV